MVQCTSWLRAGADPEPTERPEIISLSSEVGSQHKQEWHSAGAELLVEHYPEEQTRIGAHLGHATEELREMEMQPGLERALRVGELVEKRKAGTKAKGGR